jgi:hypothetical protein
MHFYPNTTPLGYFLQVPFDCLLPCQVWSTSTGLHIMVSTYITVWNASSTHLLINSATNNKGCSTHNYTRLAWLLHIQNYFHVKASKQHVFTTCCIFCYRKLSTTSLPTLSTCCTWEFWVYNSIHVHHRQGTNYSLNILPDIASSTPSREESRVQYRTSHAWLTKSSVAHSEIGETTLHTKGRAQIYQNT